MDDELSQDAHRELHDQLHMCLINLVSDFNGSRRRPLAECSLMEFLKWSAAQCRNPEEIINHITDYEHA